MRVLVACERSGIVRDAFAARGHDAWSCDILPSMLPGQHILDDVRAHLLDGWDLLIAHPPCTFLANSGVHWLGRQSSAAMIERWDSMHIAAEFFLTCYNAPVARVCVENPVMHRYAKQLISVPATQWIQPWQFGSGVTKKTGLWLRNLPPLVPTNIVPGRFDRTIHASPDADRAFFRSITEPRIAAAMAEQWG